MPNQPGAATEPWGQGHSARCHPAGPGAGIPRKMRARDAASGSLRCGRRRARYPRLIPWLLPVEPARPFSPCQGSLSCLSCLFPVFFPRMRGCRAATAGQELRTAAAARSADGAGPGLCPLLPSPPGGLAALIAFVAQVLWLRSLKPG